MNTYRERFRENRLMCFGLAAMALRSVLQTILDRNGLSNDVTDFCLGMLMGVGMGTTLLFIWRKGSGRPSPSPTAGA